MDDSCAVCADTLEWVAYGSCLHRDVCSTCVARLRFILNDHRCCICKTDNPVVFTTKAMGDYTNLISDFSAFPTPAAEGKVGGYWYHEDTQSYFDDADHYKIIKATCKLSCSVCDAGTRRVSGFKNIDQLRGHLFHHHGLLMCNFCLEGRKVFISEQKLYTKSQLNQHKNTGDTDVDGSEGFMGHPKCTFCVKHFYGENELYTHMSTEHFKCFICDRQHPGQMDYYTDYNELESHFREEHFLCENESCLEEKFVVFQTEAEIKRHNGIKHQGHMSRAQRNKVLQIPTSFQYRRPEEQDRRGRGRGRGQGFGFRADLELGDASSGVIPVSTMNEANQSAEITSFNLPTINPEAEAPRSVLPSQSSSSSPVIEDSSFPPLSDREPPESSSKYVQALHGSRNTSRLREEYFPPLPGGEKKSIPKVGHKSEILGKSSLATHLRSKRSVVVVKTPAWSRPSENHNSGSSTSTRSQNKPATNSGISSSSSAISHPQSGAKQRSSSSSPIPQVKPMRENELTFPILPPSSLDLNAANKMRHSTSAPVLVGGSTSSLAATLAGNHALPTSSHALPVAKEVHMANKSLVERIRDGLGMNEDKFTAFRDISTEYRQDKINTWEYLSYVDQFGLSHLVLELAQNCPDARKRKELTDAFNANFRGKFVQENGGNSAGSGKEGKKGKGKGKEKEKGKEVDHGNSSSRTDALTDSIMDTVKKLQSQAYVKPPGDEVETLSKDGYRTGNIKQQLSANKVQASSSSLATNLPGSNGRRELPTNSTSSNKNLSGGGSKQKKTSKFNRLRLGEGFSADLDQGGSSPEHPNSDHQEEGMPVRGVWRNGGGMKILKSQRNP